MGISRCDNFDGPPVTYFFLFQVSETENIRKNLAIERMIVEGCDILLDVNQMFVRQGTLVQILPPGSKQGTRGTNRKLL